MRHRAKGSGTRHTQGTSNGLDNVDVSFCSTAESAWYAPWALKGSWVWAWDVCRGGVGWGTTRLGPLLNAIQAKGAQRDSEQDAELLIVRTAQLASTSASRRWPQELLLPPHKHGIWQAQSREGEWGREEGEREPCKALSSEENPSDKNGTKRTCNVTMCVCVLCSALRCSALPVCVCVWAEKQWRQ